MKKLRNFIITFGLICCFSFFTIVLTSCSINTHKHTFNQEVQSDAFLEKNASCTNKTTYFYSCSCGEKGSTTFEVGEKLPHTYNQTIEKNATCKEEGIIKFTCTCGDEYSETIEKLTEHTIVDGVCSVCGFGLSCDHQTLNLKELDLSGFSCTNKFMYLECDCGERKEVLNQPIKCSENFTFSNFDEKTTVLECKVCALRVHLIQEIDATKCTNNQPLVMELYNNDQLLLKGPVYEPFIDHVDQQYIEIDLKEYGFCEGYINAPYCEICNEKDVFDLDLCARPDGIEQLDELSGLLKLNCDVDEFGNKILTFNKECDVCHGKTFFSVILYNIEDCYYVVKMHVSIEINGEVIDSATFFEFEEMHDYESSYSLSGENCNFGCHLEGTCKNCGHVNAKDVTRHDFKYEFPEFVETYSIDFSTYGCGGIIEFNKCKICGLIYYSDGSLECNFIGVDNGNDAYTTIGKCNTCNIECIWTNYEKNTGCYLWFVQDVTYKLNDEIITTYTNYIYYNTNHDYIYSSKLLGATCEDGVEIECSCKNCDYKNTNKIYSHDYSYEHFSFDDCNHNYNLSTCNRCNYTLVEPSMYNYSYKSNENGYDVYGCSSNSCNALVLKKLISRETDEGCNVRDVYHIIIKNNDVEIVSGDYKEFYTDHEIVENFELINKQSCLLGLTQPSTCTKCDYSFFKPLNEHYYLELFNIQNVEGACSLHTVNYSECICEEHAFKLELDTNNFNEDYQELTDGFIETYSCSICNMVITYKVTQTTGCIALETREFNVTKDGEVIYSKTLTRNIHNHLYNFLSYSDNTVTLKCIYCDDTKATKIIKVKGEYSFTSDKNIICEISNLSYGVLELMKDGMYIGDFYNSKLLIINEGSEYVLDTDFYDGTFAAIVEKDLSVICKHNDVGTYSLLKEGANNCFDGVYDFNYCVSCGKLNRFSDNNQCHSTFTHIIPTMEYNTCNDYLTYISCACNEFHYEILYGCASLTDDSFATVDGKTVLSYTYTCSECGLKIIQTNTTYEENESVINEIKVVYYVNEVQIKELNFKITN